MRLWGGIREGVTDQEGGRETERMREGDDRDYFIIYGQSENLIIGCQA